MIAIQTIYADHKFRSRLEARWAIFFDAIGLVWQYETEGYEMSDGTRYLPDFYFPLFDYYAEIKPENHKETQLDIKKWEGLVSESRKSIVILQGLPNSNPTLLICYEWGEVSKYTICPFANFIKAKFGYFWSSNGENMNHYFTEAISKAKQAQFEFNT